MSCIVVLVPVYDRPARVQPLINSFARSRPTDARLLFVASHHDEAEIAALENADADFLLFPRTRGQGDWARKINHGYRHTTEPWMLCCADDVHFHRGWDKHLRKAADQTGKRVLGTNDLNPNAAPVGIYSPHPLVARSYADERGTVDRRRQVVSEVYDHNYSDRELAATAIARDEWAYVPEAVVEHLHPGIKGGPADRTYRLGSANAHRDYRLHMRRHRLWKKEQRLRERSRRNAHPL